MGRDGTLFLSQTTAIRRVIGKATALLQAFFLPFIFPSNALGESSLVKRPDAKLAEESKMNKNNVGSNKTKSTGSVLASNCIEILSKCKK